MNKMQPNITESSCHVLIPSAGTGSRFGHSTPKQYQWLAGKSVIDYSVDLFTNLTEINTIWVAVSSESNTPLANQSKKIHLVPTGGDTRSQTVLNTLNLMIDRGISINDWVLVHDAARPGLSVQDVQRLIATVIDKEDCIGGILALPISDTVKKAKPSSNSIDATISRDHLWSAQTPQMFRIGNLKKAIEQAINQGIMITDESSAIEAAGMSPILVMGSIENFKITYQQDLLLMKKMINEQTTIRVGQGYDVHRLVPDRPLILGGISIPHHLGLLGHSDADALLHALTDALLGASGLGDIGQHFPDTDPQYKNADSKVLLHKTYELVSNQGFTLINMDATIVCQSPKLSKYLPDMIDTISKLLEIEPTKINIKAKTNEGLGYLGNSEAIETQVIVLLQLVK